MSSRNFLSAQWEYLAMFNYEVDPVVLQKHLPPFTEIDYFQGKALVSIVGFMFNNTKVLGLHWPGHINFEEVNLRYYVRYYDGTQWKRGVAFVSEIVAKPIIAVTANLLYNEHYSVANMNHQINATGNTLTINYSWKKRNQQWNFMEVSTFLGLMDIEKNSEEEFIFEHYYGYNRLNDATTIEYELEHPPWQVYPVKSYSITCDIEKLYGKDFVPFLADRKPNSVFLAKGSEVIVKMPTRKIF